MDVADDVSLYAFFILGYIKMTKFALEMCTTLTQFSYNTKRFILRFCRFVVYIIGLH
jgi:hypothetical protein